MLNTALQRPRPAITPATRKLLLAPNAALKVDSRPGLKIKDSYHANEDDGDQRLGALSSGTFQSRAPGADERGGAAS